MHINEMRANLVYGGARPSHFQVMITNPINPTGDLKVPFMTKAASIPASTIGQIDVGYFGRKLPYAGDRTYENWTTTVINDEDFPIRDGLEAWHAAINAPQRNVSAGPYPGLYMSQGTVTQKNKDGTTGRIYQFNNLWPAVISGIDLDWNTSDAIEEFTVTWAFTDIEIVGGNTGDGGGI